MNKRLVEMEVRLEAVLDLMDSTIGRLKGWIEEINGRQEATRSLHLAMLASIIELKMSQYSEADSKEKTYAHEISGLFSLAHATADVEEGHELPRGQTEATQKYLDSIEYILRSALMRQRFS